MSDLEYWQTLGQWQLLLVEDKDYERWAEQLDQLDLKYREQHEASHEQYEDMGRG